jgi:hypothetical protein
MYLHKETLEYVDAGISVERQESFVKLPPQLTLAIFTVDIEDARSTGQGLKSEGMQPDRGGKANLAEQGGFTLSLFAGQHEPVLALQESVNKPVIRILLMAHELPERHGSAGLDLAVGRCRRGRQGPAILESRRLLPLLPPKDLLLE